MTWHKDNSEKTVAIIQKKKSCDAYIVGIRIRQTNLTIIRKLPEFLFKFSRIQLCSPEKKKSSPHEESMLLFHHWYIPFLTWSYKLTSTGVFMSYYGASVTQQALSCLSAMFIYNSILMTQEAFLVLTWTNSINK